MRCEPADCRTGTADVVIYIDRCHRHRPCLAVVPPHDPSQQGTLVLRLCSAAPDEERAAGVIPREQHREEPTRFAPEVAEVRAAPFFPPGRNHPAEGPASSRLLPARCGLLWLLCRGDVGH